MMIHPSELPFWHFFIQLEKELSYERWIDKYRLFIHAIFIDKIIGFDDDWQQFRQFCKILYLQNIRDEARFNQLLDEAIEKEKESLVAAIAKAKTITETTSSKVEITDSITTTPPPAPASPELLENKESSPPDDEWMDEPLETPAEQIMYYHPPPIEQEKQDNGKNKNVPINYLLTDEYFPVTRRQMVKGWQFLRHKEKSGFCDGININATIMDIARNGLFLQPVYNASVRNREDAVVIFADYKGSMTPFHELTDRLIATAKGEGGHPKAPVFYFQNIPSGYVFRNPNMDSPVKLKEALIKSNRNITLAIIISDAGAARGNTDAARKQARLAITESFLAELDKTCAHTVWLNPMPSHRWTGTAAALIKEKVFLMAPVFDHSSYNFQDTFRTILKQNLKNTNPFK